MKKLLQASQATLALLASAAVSAHTGHGEPGTFAHDIQHQLWLFGALVVVGAILVLVQRPDRDKE